MRDAAGREASRAPALKPQLGEHRRWYLGHRIKHADTLEHVLDGLAKVGL